MQPQKNIFTSPVTLLVAGSVLLRLIVYLLLPPSSDFGRYTNSNTLYFSALTEHFGDYLSVNSNIPPATYIIDAWVLQLLGPVTAMNMRAFLVLVSILDIMALVILYRSCLRLGAGSRLSVIIISLLSAALVPFEIWRGGMHYDHFTFFLTSLFVWSVVRVIRNRTNYTDPLFVSVAGALLVSQSAVNAAVVPFSIVVIFVFVYVSAKEYRQLIYGLIVALLLPLPGSTGGVA